MGDLDAAESLGARYGQARRRDGFPERVTRGEARVDLLAGTGVEDGQPAVPDHAEVHVQVLHPEPLQHPVVGGQELARVAVEVRCAEVHQIAHGRASSTMLNGAACWATRRTLG